MNNRLYTWLRGGGVVGKLGDDTYIDSYEGMIDRFAYSRIGRLSDTKRYIVARDRVRVVSSLSPPVARVIEVFFGPKMGRF